MHKTTHYVYRVAYNGIFGRNRTLKFDIDKLCERAITDVAPTTKDLLVQVQKYLHSIKAKPGLRWTLREDPIEQSSYKTSTGEIVTSECFVLLSEKVMAKGVVDRDGGITSMPGFEVLLHEGTPAVAREMRDETVTPGSGSGSGSAEI